VPAELREGGITVLDIEGSGAFVSVPGLFDRLPAPPVNGVNPGQGSQPAVVVLRLRGHLRSNLTFVKALEKYAGDVGATGGAVLVCGLQPATIAQLRSAGLPDEVVLVAQGEELDGSLEEALARARAWLAAQPPPGSQD
jgi:hypothetical protein